MKSFLLFLVLFFVKAAYAQPGKLDPSFGMNGIVKTDIGSAFNYSSNGKQVLLQHDGSMYLITESAGLSIITKKYPNGSPDLTYGNNSYSVPLPVYPNQCALQPDGKILIAGSASSRYQEGGRSHFAIARLNTDGTLDDSFAEKGMKILSLGDQDVAICIALQNDGKIVVAGSAFNYDQGQHIILARLNADGTSDYDFGNFGVQQTDFGDNGYAGAVAIQPDGKIVVAGNTLVRYDANGILDSTFSSDGYQLIPGTACAIGIQNDSKLIVATNSFYEDSLGINFLLSRYDTDGNLDSSFGENGIKPTDFGGVSQTATTMVIQGDGKIILGGYIDDGININFGITRYKQDGGLDNSFSGDGMLTTDFSSGNDYLNSIALQDDGKLLALGGTNNGINSRVAVARYDTIGNPDIFFDGNPTFTDHLIQGSAFYTCTTAQTDGKIIAAGYAWNGSNYDFALARYNLNGTLDNTFSGDGIQMTDFGFSDDKAQGIAIQADGKIVVCGSAGEDFGLTRYNSDGSLDISFAGDGMQVTDFGAVESANNVLIQHDGKIIAAGSVLARYNGNGSLDTSLGTDGYLAIPSNSVALQEDGKIVMLRNNNTIARYNTNGFLDNTFGDNGERFLSEFYSPYDFFGTTIKIQRDGKIVVAGYGSENTKGGTTSQFTLGRLNIDGSFDPTFNNGGVASSVNSVDFPTSAIIQNDGKLIQAGYSNDISGDNFMITRHNSDGSPDNTFGIDGIQVTHVSTVNDRITGLAVTGNYLYAAGYGQYPGNLGVIARYLLVSGGGTAASAFITTTDGDWNDPDIWFGGVVPNESAEVTVQHKITVTANARCYTLKVEPPSGNLIVNTGVNLTITH